MERLSKESITQGTASLGDSIAQFSPDVNPENEKNIRNAKKPNQPSGNAFEEAVRRSGLDFDDAVMAETRAEAESRQAAQNRAERRGTVAQTGVDKAAYGACRQAWWSRS